AGAECRDLTDAGRELRRAGVEPRQRGAKLVSTLTAAPAYATTFSLTLRRGPHQGGLALAGHVRITGGSDSELIGVRRTLEQAARAAKVGLVRLDREQLPGVHATLPLGGVL
ncbi:hypothetical protein AB0M96_37330, partial [Streptomyces sp. NPDC051098]